MKRFVLFIVCFFCYFAFSQHNKIDSINNIPFQNKIKNAVVLEKVYLQNIAQAQKVNYPFGEATACSNLSLLYYYQGKYEKDISYSLQAITLFQKHNNTEALAREYGELGYRMKKRNFKKAVFYMQKAKNLSEKNQLQKPLLSIYNNYGVLKEMKNELDSALYYYNKGLTLKLKLKDIHGIPYSLNNIAGVYCLKKDFILAENNYKKALKIRQQIKDTIGIAENFTYLGKLYSLQNKNQNALEYFQKALHLGLKYKYLDIVQDNYLNISKSYEKLNDTNLAFVNYKKHTQFKDSLLNLETNKKVAELEILYTTQEQEKTILKNKIEVKNKNFIILFCLGIIIFITIIGFLFYRQQKIKNQQQQQEFSLKEAISKIETQNQLQEQRLLISRDLHDNIGAQLTFIISSVENLKFGFPTIDEKISTHLTKISNFTKDTIVELRDTIWAMNTSDISIDDLRTRLHNFIEKAQTATQTTNFSFEIDEDLVKQKITSVQGINIYRVIQEAVNNAIKHSQAQKIEIKASTTNNQLFFEIIDNGKGFQENEVVLGNGLYNMKKRIEEIQGTFSYSSSPSGTRILFSIAEKNT